MIEKDTFWTPDRISFEKWATDNGWFIQRIDCGHRYTFDGTQIAWHAWQGAKTDERKQMASLVQKICELLEMADNRAMAADGPINNDEAFNELDLREKRIFYKCCDAIRKIGDDL